MRKLMNYLLFVGSLAISQLAFSDWVEGYIDEIASQVDTIGSGGDPDAPSYNQPSQLLPLSSLNQWTFVYTDVFEGTSQNLNAVLGAEEDVGDLCLPPMLFDNDKLVLYLQNLNDRILLHGFRIKLSSGDFSLFFRDGIVSDVSSGIILASNDFSINLEQEQAGSQQQLIDGEIVNLKWKVSNKQYQTVNNLKTYLGEVSGIDASQSPEKTSELKFYLYINNSYIATLDFSFLPGVGLSKMTLQGDHPGLGGQFHHIYELPTSPEKSFYLSSQLNEIVDYSCLDSADYSNIAGSNAGVFVNWFNILMLIVVVLEGYRSYSLTPLIRNNNN